MTLWTDNKAQRWIWVDKLEYLYTGVLNLIFQHAVSGFYNQNDGHEIKDITANQISRKKPRKFNTADYAGMNVKKPLENEHKEKDKVTHMLFDIMSVECSVVWSMMWNDTKNYIFHVLLWINSVGIFISIKIFQYFRYILRNKELNLINLKKVFFRLEKK